MRTARVGAALASLVLASAPASAQQRGADRIPVAVARAAMWVTMPFGTPRFFDGQLPAGWPAGLVPPGARVVGGSIIGDPSMFLLRTAVFELRGAAAGDSALSDLFSRAGYSATRPPMPEVEEGFVSSGAAPTMKDGFPRFCKDAVAATFAQVDSNARRPVHAVTLIEGEAALQTCGALSAPSRDRRFPVDIPPLAPPAGVTQTQGASSWGNADGSSSATVQTAMSADSLLAHYTAQLVAAGWRADGRPALTENVGVQRLAMRRDEEDWNATLLVLRSGERSELRLEVARRE